MRARNLQLRSNTKGERNIFVRYMAGPQSKHHWNSQVTNHAQYNFFQSVALIFPLHAIQHLAEYYAPNVCELARQFELHQHAVDLEWLLGHVFNEQDGPRCVNFIRRSQRSDQHRKTSPVKNALAGPLYQGLHARLRSHIEDPVQSTTHSKSPRSGINAVF